MKVLFLFQGLTPYNNTTMGELNALDDVDVINVVPRTAAHLEAAVYQKRDGLAFRVVEMDEVTTRAGGLAFAGLWRVLLKERPDVVVCTPPYLKQFLHSVPLHMVMRGLRIGLVMRSIPFRMPPLPQLTAQMAFDLEQALSRPSPRLRGLRSVLSRSRFASARKVAGALRAALDVLRKCRGLWRIKREVFAARFWARFPDVQATYTEAGVGLYESYGVDPSRVVVTFNSPNTKSLLRARDLVAEEDGSRRDPKRLIHVGRLVEWKRVDLLITALAKLRSRHENVSLTIVGDGPQRAACESLARELDLDDSITFAGAVHEPLSLARHLASAGVYVLAGMGGLSLNEAMCFSLPVVCSVCDGTEKHLVFDGHNGLYFDGGVEDLVRKIECLTSNPGMAEAMGKNSLRIIQEEVNESTVASGYLDACNRAARRRIAPVSLPGTVAAPRQGVRVLVENADGIGS